MGRVVGTRLIYGMLVSDQLRESGGEGRKPRGGDRWERQACGAMAG